jgi:hypothetical protein
MPWRRMVICLETRLVVLALISWVDGLRSVQKAGDGGQMQALGADHLGDLACSQRRPSGSLQTHPVKYLKNCLL